MLGEHGAVLAQQQGPLAHLLDEGAVALVGAFQGEDARAFGGLHGQRINSTGADGRNQVLGLLQPLAQLLVFLGQLGGGARRAVSHAGTGRWGRA